MTTDPRRALAALRYDANLAIDGPFAELAPQAEAIILKHARTGKDGVPRLDAMGIASARFELRRLLQGKAGELTGIVAGRIVAAEVLATKQAEAVTDGA